MRKLISLIFEVIKAWLARSNTPPKPAETKQKISQSGVINIYIDNGGRKG